MPATTERIAKTPGLCGGDACIGVHRIPVWVLVNFRRLVLLCQLGASLSVAAASNLV
jgi:hypothetical protein